MHINHCKAAWMVATGLAAVLAVPSYAQEAGQSAEEAQTQPAVGEIVVTARSRYVASPTGIRQGFISMILR